VFILDLNHTNKKQKIQHFNPKTIDCRLIIVVFAKISGKLYPPKKKIGVIVLKSTIEEYSLKRKQSIRKRYLPCGATLFFLTKQSLIEGRFIRAETEGGAALRMKQTRCFFFEGRKRINKWEKASFQNLRWGREKKMIY
jgi:hypothetical protein